MAGSPGHTWCGGSSRGCWNPPGCGVGMEGRPVETMDDLVLSRSLDVAGSPRTCVVWASSGAGGVGMRKGGIFEGQSSSCAILGDAMRPLDTCGVGSFGGCCIPSECVVAMEVRPVATRDSLHLGRSLERAGSPLTCGMWSPLGAGGSHRWSGMEEVQRLRWIIFVLGDSWRWWGAPGHVQHMWRGLLQVLVDPSGCSLWNQHRFSYESYFFLTSKSDRMECIMKKSDIKTSKCDIDWVR
ncbi:uncharacterized protein LOC100988855 isoform X1 [Pan paniscus]|uniref:uncharacterized protein LOC100988855 isoform X1 n=1 Tax=Pan paniscus TaxID=9597 RepID=UPI0024366D98|nr:uncharacterized protein LOC100988855 isoform X1 [Pan paniscus]